MAEPRFSPVRMYQYNTPVTTHQKWRATQNMCVYLDKETEDSTAKVLGTVGMLSKANAK